MWKQLCCVLLFIVSIPVHEIPVHSQNGSVPGVKVHYGFIIAHSRSIRDISTSKPWGIEAEWNWQLMSRNAWNYCYCFPRTGISFFYIDFGNAQVLGHSYAPYVFIEPVLGADKRLNSSIRFGIGPAFMDKVYDEVTNPENLCYSSLLSFIVLLNASVNYRITKQWSLSLSGYYNHISNGGIKNPNKGINFPTLSLGIDYNLRDLTFYNYTKSDTTSVRPDKWSFDITGFCTGKTDIKGEQHFAVYGITGSARRIVARLSALSMAVEGTADNADKMEIRRKDMTKNGKWIDHKYLAVLAGHDLLIGRFIFSLQLGMYLYSPFKRRDLLYQRYGLTFHLNDWLFLGTSLKAHRHVADFLDFRAGISF
jgi:hypothetical protein